MDIKSVKNKIEQNVFIWGNTAYITYKFLFDRKVPEQTVYNHTSKKSKQQWFTKRHPSNYRIKLIAYNSIPQSTIEEYNLPGLLELKTIAETQSKLIRENYSTKTSIILKTILDYEYQSWETITAVYRNEFFDAEKLESFCKTHLLLSKISELTEFGYKLKDLHTAYLQYDGLVFESDSYHSFCNKIRKIKNSKSIEIELLHKLRKRESNNHKMTDDINIEIMRYYSDPKNFSAEYITKKVNEYLLKANRKTISLNSVEKLIGLTCIKNTCMLSRKGIKYTKEHLIPYLPFEQPRFLGTLWLIDGSRFQFIYKTEKSKFNFLTLFVIMEGKTREILGFSYDKSENSLMVTNALEMACRRAGYLPKELICDGSPAYKQSNFLTIISNLRDWGVIWRRASGPQDNAYVERWFKTIQDKFCKEYDGYIGDGITSRDENGKPSPEELKKNLVTKNIRNLDGLIALIKEVIGKYNSEIASNGGKEEHVFKDKSKNKNSISPIKLNSIMLSKLFWKQNLIKMHRGMIIVAKNNTNYYYYTQSKKIITEYSGNIVRIRYDDSNPSIIMLFEKNSDKFICKMGRHVPFPKPIAERSEEDNTKLFKHISNNKRLMKQLQKSKLELEEKSDINRELLPPDLAQLIPVSKFEQEKAEDDFINTKLRNVTNNDEMKIFELKENLSYEELFKNLYKVKGDLKIFNNGRN